MFPCIKSLLAAVALGALVSFPAVATENPMDIPFMGGYVEEHPVVSSVWKPFFEATEKKFAGKVKFSYYTENMLYSNQAEAVQGISDGRTFFGTIRPAVHPEEFRLLGVINIPGLAPNAVVGSLVMADIIEKFPAIRAELPKGSEHFTSWTSASYQIHTKEPMPSLKDLQGKKIVVWDVVSHVMVREMGAIPVLVSPPDTYWTLQRGLAEGIMCPLAPLNSYRLSGLVKHHLMLDAMVQGFIMEASHKHWKAMPRDMQKWFKAEGGAKMALAIAQALEERVQAETAVLETMEHSFHKLSDADMAEFDRVKAVMAENWKEYCEGIEPALLDKVLTYARKRAEFYTKEWAAGKYRD